jgi:type IV pilus assembly protein PilA
MKKHTTLKSKFNSAFSLVELLVVIAVIAIIAAIAIPNITGARQSAEDGKWISDKATVERRIAEAAEATGTAPTVQQILDGVTLTNRDTSTVMTYRVESTFTAAQLTNSVPPSQQ